ncbi:hypothetical protein BUALT_Bualt02G0223900 [Buddleja alternifolia]|uniref:Uncharacterized protein n=1 Tax=Buddleja alternifolia TaxID=168488 RepID=A0AAV6YB55_9LAMI|nr:hypothetical protein BUALT_Bualt02G0223900 [Buddleja alternifolia]
MAQNQKSNNCNKIFKWPIKAKIPSISQKNPFKTTPKPLQIVHQPQTIPIETEYPHEKEASSSNPKRETITFYGQGKGQKDAKPLASPRGNVEKVETKPSDLVSAAKTKSTKDDGVDEDEVKENDKFTDYITKVKDKMRNVSNVGRSATRRDSFNDKISSYINRARIKMRTTTTNVGDDNNVYINGTEPKEQQLQKIFKWPIKAKIPSISQKNPFKTTPKPLQIVHQPQTIPIETEYPHEKEASSSNPKRETITFYGQGKGQKDAKPLASPRGNVEKVETKPSDLVSAAKTKSTKDGVDEDEVKENDKFTDYITKVKDKMRNVSNVGRSATRRDSFNEKISSYINHARIKMGTTTTNDGDDKNV